MKTVTLLIPCYNEEKSLPKLYDALIGMMAQNALYEWKVLFINDGSRDHTLQVLKDIRQRDARFGYISLSRNFGKEAAMLAGFDYATGDCVVIMDADLQHPPMAIPLMLKEWEAGFEDVYARRTDRGKEPWLRRQFSLLYYWMLQKMTNVDILQNVGDFRLLDRKCIEALRQLRETTRYTKGMYCWIGFKKKEILFEQGDRQEGVSSFNFYTLLKLAIEGVTSYTTLPLRISTLLAGHTVIYGDPVAGYPTLMVVILFLGGAQLLSLGIIGEYLGRIFHESKHRPVYLVSEHDA